MQSASCSTTTDDRGRFRFDLPPGRYLVTASTAGFAENLSVADAGSDVTIRLTLQPVASEVTVTAEINRVASAEAVPQPVTILTRRDIEAHPVVLSAAAEGAAGVHQLRTSPAMGAFFVRGLTGKNVAVFRDGVRYTTSAQRGGVSTFFNLLEPAALDSVEILRGPNSAQYGSDSLGGTVAAVTRPAEFRDAAAWHGELAPFYESSANAFGASALLGAGGPRLAFNAGFAGRRVNTLRTGGGIDSHAAVTRFLGLPSTILGDRLPDTAFTGYGGSLHAQARLSGLSQMIVHYERAQQDGGKRYDQLLGGDGNLIADLRNLMLDFAYLRFQRFAAGPLDQVSLTGSYNAQREERVNQGGQGNPAAAITHQYEKTKAWGLQSFVDKRLQGVELLLGGDGYAESIAAPSFSVVPSTGAVSLVRPRIPDGARYLTYGVFTQAAWLPLRTERLRLSGGLRFGGASYRSRAAVSPVVSGRPLWPDDSLAANAVTGRGGIAAWATGWLGFHAHYSRGFRAPNVTDLGTVGLQGNGAYEAAVADLAGRGAQIGDRADDLARSTGLPVEPLRPELSDNIDAGARLRAGSLRADFTYFYLSLDNSIISQTLILPAGAVGQQLGEQAISRQLPSGAVFVPTSASPVLVRSNFSGARIRGIESSFRAPLSRSWSIAGNLTRIHAEDARTGLPPDMEPGIPPLTFNTVLTWRPAASRWWVELYSTLAGRQDRLSSLALSDRRIGNPRSRSTIQAFFNNGARVRGLVATGILVPTGETLAQVQNRVLGSLNSAPQFAAVPGYAFFGLRGGWSLGEGTDVIADFSNVADHNGRGIGWGIDRPGRAVLVRLRHRF